MSFLFVDSILDLSSDRGSVRGLKQISSEDIYFSKGDDQQLRFMPSIIGETLGQMTAWAVMQACDFQKRPVAGVVGAVTLHQDAHLGDCLSLESWIELQDEDAVRYHGQVHVGDRLILSLEGALGPMLPMQDFIDPALARQQFSQIHQANKTLRSPNRLSQIKPIALSFDQIIQNEPGISILALKKISPDAPFFPDHFPLKPVLPLTVLLELKMQLAGQFLQESDYSTYHVKALERIKMNDFVLPGDEISTRISIKSKTENELRLHLRTEVAGKRVCICDMLCESR